MPCLALCSRESARHPGINSSRPSIQGLAAEDGISTPIYVAETAGTNDGPIPAALEADTGIVCSQPAESQERGIENSDQPQSRQVLTSGDGFNGGWLSVRGLFR